MVPTATSAAPVSFDALHAHFLQILPLIDRHGEVYFRHLRCWHRLQEALAEMRGLAWKWFLRLHEQGKDAANFPSVLAVYAARAVRSGRRLCGQERAKDVLSGRAQQHETLHGAVVARAGQRRRGQRDHGCLRDNTKSPPDEQAAFRIDFPAWLLRHTDRNRRIAHDMALGERTRDLADKYGTTQGRISQLRRDFRADWMHFTGEPVL